MQDRYLFRGKRVDNGEWAYGGYYEWGDNPHIVQKDIWDKSDVFASLIPVCPTTIGQCTGLRDKNGKLIFEGDVIKSHYANAPKADHTEQVVFRNGKFMAECNIGDTGKCWAPLADGVGHVWQDKSVYMEWCEIIGNIHDNPELLSKEA